MTSHLVHAALVALLLAGCSQRSEQAKTLPGSSDTGNARHSPAADSARIVPVRLTFEERQGERVRVSGDATPPGAQSGVEVSD